MKTRSFLRQEEPGTAITPELQSVSKVGRRRLLGLGSLAVSGLAIAGTGGRRLGNAAVSENAQASLATDEPTEHQRTYYSKARF